MDGSGEPAYRADVAITGDRIVAVGDLSGASAIREVNVAGAVIAPGFIDLHSHADGGGDSGGLRSRDPRRRAAPNLVAQGVTTVVVNQDGRSMANIRLQREQLEERGFGPNTVLMVGHNTVRQMAMPGSNYARPATRGEIEKMRGLVRLGMEAGAWGLTAGLEYVPGRWSTTDELIALVQEIAPFGGVYIVHERSSGVDPMWVEPSQDPPDQPTMLDSILETIRIADATGVTVVATHIKARGTGYWGQSRRIIDVIRDARDRGLRVYADQYPYTSSGSDGVVVLLPRRLRAHSTGATGGGGRDFAGSLRTALSDPSTAAGIRRDVAHKMARRGGAENILIVDHPDEDYIGKSLAEIATARGLSPIDTVFHLQFEGFGARFGGAQLRAFSMSQDDVDAFAAQPWTATASDAGIALPEDNLVHARCYGTFPRKLRDFALDRRVLSLEQAVHSMTALPAEIMAFPDRGLVREGYVADLTVFDPKRIAAVATFFDPHQYPEGIDYVMINGEFVVDGGFRTLALPGRVLRPPLRLPDSD